MPIVCIVLVSVQSSVEFLHVHNSGNRYLMAIMLNSTNMSLLNQLRILNTADQEAAHGCIVAVINYLLDL